jgi:hypothetical protein
MLLLRRARLAASFVAVFVGSASCADTGASPASPSPARTTAVAPTPDSATEPSQIEQPTTEQPTTERPTTVTAIRITVDGQPLIAELADNPTARDLVDQLPVTLTFRDFNRVEKLGTLPRPLTTNDASAGADPEVNDIGYYAPSGDLVFYYGDVGYFDGIVRIGRFDNGDLDVIERLPDGFEVTIEQT